MNLIETFCIVKTYTVKKPDWYVKNLIETFCIVKP